jgi:hypothetical protein
MEGKSLFGDELSGASMFMVAHCTHICRVGQNRIYTLYMTVYMVNSLPKIPYTHRIYMVLANPTHMHQCCAERQAAATIMLTLLDGMFTFDGRTLHAQLRSAVLDFKQSVHCPAILNLMAHSLSLITTNSTHCTQQVSCTALHATIVTCKNSVHCTARNNCHTLCTYYTTCNNCHIQKYYTLHCTQQFSHAVRNRYRTNMVHCMQQLSHTQQVSYTVRITCCTQHITRTGAQCCAEGRTEHSHEGAVPRSGSLH